MSEMLVCNDGDWHRLAKRLAHALRDGVSIARSYKADFPDADVVYMCDEFIIEAKAALEDD